jgi:hypothetical protein
MAEETINNSPLINSSVNDDDTGNDSRSESDVRVTSSSLTRGAALMADGKIPSLSDFFNKMMVMDSERQGYHDLGWLTGNLLSSIPEVDVPTVDGSFMLCFESHLIAGLGLPPGKFLVSIMNFLACSLIHFNPNALAALSSFTMLCECWLGISLDSSLLWYYYSPVHYDQTMGPGNIKPSFGRSTSRPPSKATGNTSNVYGCWLICIL